MQLIHCTDAKPEDFVILQELEALLTKTKALTLKWGLLQFLVSPLTREQSKSGGDKRKALQGLWDQYSSNEEVLQYLGDTVVQAVQSVLGQQAASTLPVESAQEEVTVVESAQAHGTGLKSGETEASKSRRAPKKQTQAKRDAAVAAAEARAAESSQLEAVTSPAPKRSKK